MALPDTSLSRAVLVGAASYDDPGLPPLPAAGRNVRRLAELLTNREIWGLPPEHCRQVIDPASDADAALAVARAAQEAQDTLLVYMTGHGLVSRGGELVLATRRTAAEWPQFSGLRYSWIREAMAAARARRTIVVVDSCFSGRAVEAMGGEDSTSAGRWEIRGAYVLTATTANAAALSPEGEPYTAFSASLFDALAGGWADGPQFLRLSDIFELIRKDMVRAGRPQPMQMSTSRIGELPLVRNTAWCDSAVAVTRRIRRPAVAVLDRIDVSLRIVSYQTLPALDQVDAQLAFIGMVNDAVRYAGLDSAGWTRRPAAGLETITMPAGSLTLPGLTDMLVALAASLERHNGFASRRSPLRLSAEIRMSPDPPAWAPDDGEAPLGRDPHTGPGLHIILSPGLAELVDDSDALPGRLRHASLDGRGHARYEWTL